MKYYMDKLDGNFIQRICRMLSSDATVIKPLQQQLISCHLVHIYISLEMLDLKALEVLSDICP